MDDSGTRHPDHNPKDGNDPDWFGLGGVIIDESDKNRAEDLIGEFRLRWPEIKGAPFHSNEIRNRSEGFRWLEHDPDRAIEFLDEISKLIVDMPIIALACVVDRRGYNRRYRPQYGTKRWSLCNTVFPIAVERAAKFARSRDAKLRIYVERSDKCTEAQFKTYYEEMRNSGLPFNVETSAQYAPLTQHELRETLYEFGIKTKQSDLMQIADLALWPLCIGRYRPGARPFKMLHENGKTLDELCTDENGLAGSKYSCFDDQ